MRKSILLLSLLVASYSFAGVTNLSVKCVKPRMLAGGNGADVTGTLALTVTAVNTTATGYLDISVAGVKKKTRVNGIYQNFGSYKQLNLAAADSDSEYGDIFLDFKESENQMKSNIKTKKSRSIFTFCGK